MMGNSGGGLATIFTAACDERVDIAVPSCSYTPFMDEQALLLVCPCYVVPQMAEFGEVWDIGALIAPRYLLAVHGREDSRSGEAVDDAVARLRRIYEAARAGGRLEHRYGEAGHRFYSDLMWPFIAQAMEALAAERG
jgi:hypothetical protein